MYGTEPPLFAGEDEAGAGHGKARFFRIVIQDTPTYPSTVMYKLFCIL